MKLSESLLKDEDLGKRIFYAGAEKAKTLLTEIFGLDFKGNDSRITNLSEDIENRKFKIEFNLNNRDITTEFYYEKNTEDILCEILSISEIVIEEIPLVATTDNFKDIEKNIHDTLEEKYDLNFIPLDPDDKDINIKNVNIDYKSKTWDAIFTADYHESEFRATYKYDPDASTQIIKVTEYKRHLIYLD